MPQISLFLLGAPRLLRDGLLVGTDTRKAVALLAYLAVTGQPQSRDALAALFYPEYDEAHARGALRRTLSALNKALGGEHLHADREQIALADANSLWVDVRQFDLMLTETDHHIHPLIEECPDCLARLERSAVLYRGDFMAGFSLRDSPGFDDWQFFQNETLRRRFASVLQRLTFACRRRGEMDKAIEYARRWLALDTLVEDAHRALMRAYAQAGQRSAALRQFHECVRILKDELDVEPLEETRRLYQEIHDNRLAPDFLPVRASPAEDETSPNSLPGTSEIEQTPSEADPRPLRLPLLGREREMDAFRTHFKHTSDSGTLIVIDGEPGIGKSRLAEEMLAVAAGMGALTFTARCYPGESGLAYTLFIELLRSALQSMDDAELLEIPSIWLVEAARLLPELHYRVVKLPHPVPLNDPGALNSFFEGLRQVLIYARRGAPVLVLFLDDLQWADSASLDLLAFIIRRLPTTPLFLIAAWRDENLPPQERLLGILVDAQRAGFAAHFKLDRLSQAEAGEIIRCSASLRRAGHVQFSEQLAKRLYLETEGLPFFLIEYLEALHQDFEAVNPALAVGARWPLPENVRDLLHLRITDLDELARQILATAAVIGRSFDFDTLAAAAGRSEAETIAGLERLQAHGLIIEGGESGSLGGVSYDFSHDKLRVQVYDETSAIRRRLLHRRVAEFLVEQLHHSPQPEYLAGQIARHFRLAGQDSKAAGYFQQAGDAARRLYANRLALEHYIQALECGHPNPAALYESLGELYTLLGEYGPAVEAFRQAIAAGKPAEISRIAHKMGTTYQRSGEWPLAIAHYRFALDAQSPPSEALAARILADWSLAALQSNDLVSAAELAHRALNRADNAADPLAVAQAYNLLGILARRTSHSAEARRHLEKSVKIAEEIGDDAVKAAALNNLALLLEELSDLPAAIHNAQIALALSEQIGDRHRAAALHNNLADLLHHSGQPEEAMVHLKQAVAIFAQIEAVAGSDQASKISDGHLNGFQPEIWKLIEW